MNSEHSPLTRDDLRRVPVNILFRILLGILTVLPPQIARGWLKYEDHPQDENEPSFGKFNFGQILAVLNILFKGVAIGERDVMFEKLMRDEITAEVRFTPTVPKLFNHHGQVIRQPKIMTTAPGHSSCRIKPTQPVNWERGDGFQLPGIDQNRFCPNAPSIGQKDFDTQIKLTLEWIKRNHQIANLLKGVWFPLLLPQIPQGIEHGAFLEESLLPILGARTRATGHADGINNYHKGNMNNITINDPGHLRLCQRLQLSSVIGVMFFPFADCSISNQRNFMASLPPEIAESLSLAGMIDTAIAMETWPTSLLEPTTQRPRLVCSGVDIRTSDTEISGIYMDHVSGQIEIEYVNLEKGEGIDNSGLFIWRPQEHFD